MVPRTTAIEDRVGPPGEAEGLPPLAPGEREGVEAIFGTLEKTSRVFTLYPPNNKIFIDFTDELARRIQSFLEEHGELDLIIQEDRIEYRERPVYREDNRAKSLSMKMFRDGIRKIVIYEGLTKEEVLDLLDVLTRQPDPNSLEDDMITLFWEKDFSHLSYFVLDDPFEEQEEIDLGKSVKQQEREPEEGSPGKPKRERYLAPKLSTQTLSSVLTITEHDLDAVKAMVAQENARNLRHDLTTLLFEMLNIRKDEVPFTTTIRTLGRLARSYVVSGNLAEAVSVLQKFRECLADDIEGQLKEAIREELAGLVDPEVTREVGKLFEQPILVSAKEVAELLRLLGPAVIPSLVDMLPRARSVQVLTGILLDLGRETPGKLIERLSDRDPIIVRHVLSVLGSMKDESLVPHLRPHLEHPTVPVRFEAVRALGKIGGEPATEALLQAVRDPEYQVRIHSLRCIAETGNRSLAPDLRKIVSDREFLDRNLYEKQEFYRTLARIEPEPTVSLLADILDRSSFFRRAKTDENRAAAATALGYVRTPAAREHLEKHAGSSSKSLKEACLMAMRRLDQAEEPEGE